MGAHFPEYDGYLVLSHFKGHAMAGFGGAIKNISIGMASREGKCLIHTAGASRTTPWGGEQDPFLESMAEAGKSVVDALDGNILYISVMNHLSVDCDCDGNPAEPDMHDIGILASTDPVALDQACVDACLNAAPLPNSQLGANLAKPGWNCYHDNFKDSNPNIEWKATLEQAEKIGMGTRKYTLKKI